MRWDGMGRREWRTFIAWEGGDVRDGDDGLGVYTLSRRRRRRYQYDRMDRCAARTLCMYICDMA
jgi:hypothetical protein